MSNWSIKILKLAKLRKGHKIKALNIDIVYNRKRNWIYFIL